MTFNDSTACELAAQTTRTCRVLLIDGHRILREAVRSIIDASEGFEVVGEAAGATQALQLIESLQPDLVVTDLPLPDRSGVKFIAEFLLRRPQAAVLVLSAIREERASGATKAGARGYLRKECGRAELLAALREVAAGRRYVCESFSAPRRRSAREEPEIGGNPTTILSERQLEVLRSVALGYRNKDIAQRLSVSVKAVQKHRARLSNLLNLHGTAALTLYAVRTGLVSEGFGFHAR